MGTPLLQCINIQAGGTLAGDLMATSAPILGSRDDSATLQMRGAEPTLEHSRTSWDAGTTYIATTAIMPIKRAPEPNRLDWGEDVQ